MALQDDKNTVPWWMIIVAIAGGTGGGTLIQKTTDARYDPFTGEQGQEHERRLDQLEIRRSICEYRIGEITKMLAGGRSREHDRITALSAEIKRLEGRVREYEKEGN